MCWNIDFTFLRSKDRAVIRSKNVENSLQIISGSKERQEFLSNYISAEIMNAMNAKLLSCAKFRPTAILVLSICNSARRKRVVLGGRINYLPSALWTRKF